MAVSAKLSDLQTASALAGGELIYVLQGGNSRQVVLGAPAAKALDDTGETGALTSLGGGASGVAVFKGDTDDDVIDALDGYIPSFTGAAARSLRGRLEQGISVLDFGAVADGDGVGGGTDNTAAIQAAVDFAAALTFGAAVHIPRGIYSMASGRVTMASNVRVYGDGRGTVLDYTSAALGGAFRGTGTYGTEIALTANTNAGGTLLSATAHGRAVDDWIILKSQRNALSEDAGLDQTGVGTAGAPEAYFAEAHQVREVVDADSFRIAGAVKFDGYRTDVTLDPNSGRTAATIAHIEWVENARIEDLHIIPGATGSTDIRFVYGKDCIVRGVTVDWPSDADITGGFIFLENCLNCRGERSTSTIPAGWVYDQVVNQGVSHASWNWFKVVGGWGTGFIGCKAYNGSQPFDVTYRNEGIIPVDSFWHFCENYDCVHDSFTTHSGGWGGLSIGCKTWNTNTGMNLRSRGWHVIGFKATGRSLGNNDGTISGDNGDIGINCQNGWTVDCKFSDCYIEGFKHGVTYERVGSQGDGFAAQRTVFENITFSRCEREFLFHDDLVTAEPCCVELKDITSTRHRYGTACIEVEGYWNQLLVDGYTVKGRLYGSSAATNLFTFANCHKPILRRARLTLVDDAAVNGAVVTAIADTGTFLPAIGAVDEDIDIEVLDGAHGTLISGTGARSAPNTQNSTMDTGGDITLRKALKAGELFVLRADGTDTGNNLENIFVDSGTETGAMLQVRSVATARNITLVNATGNLRLHGSASITLNNSSDCALLYYDKPADQWRSMAPFADVA